jgi:hypothetical protein
MFRIRRRNWFIKRIAVGFAVAAFAAPVAHAKVGDQAWPGVNPSDYAVTSVKASDYHTFRPSPHDPSIGRGDHGSAANAHKPHRLGGALARVDSQGAWSMTASILRDQPSALEDQRSATGFDWGDAGIGASLALALVLLGGGAVLAARQAGREQTA